jgi:hypothetical protein
VAQYTSGTPVTYTPTASTTTLSHWALTVLTAGQLARIKMINWGGLGTSLVGQQHACHSDGAGHRFQ